LQKNNLVTEQTFKSSTLRLHLKNIEITTHQHIDFMELMMGVEPTTY